MSVCQSNFETSVQSAIDGLTSSSSAEAVLETAIAVKGAGTTNQQYTLALGCDLPDLATNPVVQGTMVYVDEFKAPLFATTKEWKGLDGRTYRKDIPDTPMFATGWNSSGNLGTGAAYTSQLSFTEVMCSLDWCEVATGSNATNAIDTTGKMWGFGAGNCYNLGTGSTSQRCSPVAEKCCFSWSNVAKSSYVTAAVRTDGTMWGWGMNHCGQLGLGCASSYDNGPTQEKLSATDWCCAVAGANGWWSAALKNDGTLWSTGLNQNYSFGTPSIPSNTKCCCYTQQSPSIVWSKVEPVLSMGHVAIKPDGTLHVWGSQNYGEFGINTGTGTVCSPIQEYTSSTNWCSATGSFGIAALKTDGTLWNWGRGLYGSNGNNSTANVSSPVQEITSSTNWCYAFRGPLATAAIKTDGTLWAFGSGYSGGMGTGDEICRSSPVQEATAATTWSCAVTQDNGWMMAIKNIT